jgi:hypothetical protein
MVTLTLYFSDELNDALEKMTKDTNSTTSEVLLKSITLLRIALKAKQKGQSLGIFDDNDNIVKVIIGF